MGCFSGKQAQHDEILSLSEEVRSKQACIERQAEELRLSRLRIIELEGLVTLKSSVDSLTASVQQQETQHLSAADAQQRQLHAFNLALLEQAEELAALQALLGVPSRKRQSSRRRVTEDLMDSLDNLHVGGVIKRQSGDPLSIDLSTAAGASGPLEPVPELEADVRAQKPEMDGSASVMDANKSHLIQANRFNANAEPFHACC